MMRPGLSDAELRAQLSYCSQYRATVTVKGQSQFDNFEVTSQPQKIQPEDRTRTANQARKNNAGPALALKGIEFHNNGNYEEALEIFQAALESQRAQYGERHPIVAHTLANIGAVFLKQGRVFVANKALEKAWEIKAELKEMCTDEKARSKIDIADVLNNLGNVAYLRGDYSESMQFYRQSLKNLCCREALDPDLANALHNMGRLHVIQQQWDPALSVLLQCQQVEEELYGLESTELADTMELLGYVHLSNGDSDKAMISFSGALSIHQQHYGAVHENVATALINVAMVMEGQGNLKGACQTYATARDVFKRIDDGEEHQGYQAATRSYNNLKMLIRAGKHQKSEKSFTTFLRIAEEAEKDANGSSETQDPSGYHSSEARDL